MSEWIERTPNELDQDAVGLWQIVASGRDGFELSGEELDVFVRRSISALLVRGAVPVSASATKGKFWDERFDYGSSVEDITNNVIVEWHNAGVDPDHEGVWFALVD